MLVAPLGRDASNVEMVCGPGLVAADSMTVAAITPPGARILPGELAMHEYVIAFALNWENFAPDPLRYEPLRSQKSRQPFQDFTVSGRDRTLAAHRTRLLSKPLLVRDSDIAR